MSTEEKDQIPSEGSAETVASEEGREATVAPAPAAKVRRRRFAVIAGVVVAVLVVAGAGFFVWHEQPSFCAAICHTPMDAYLDTYEADPQGAATDKWGNDVANASAMLSPVHAQANQTCLDCHEPTLSEQVGEGLAWVAGDYEFPLVEKNTADLTAATGKASDEFCLNESCHNLTRDDLYAATEDMGLYNPHWAHHEELDCGTCHKAHRASVMYCTQCHASAEVPEGWLTADESNKLVEAQRS